MAGSDRNKYFDSDQLQGELEKRSVRGGAVQSVAQAATTGVQIGATVVLARLLQPEDFGLIGMVVAVTGILERFKDMGLAKVTVQREDISHDQVSALFWINAAVSAGLLGVVAALSPLLGWFYQEPRLVEITILYSGTFLLGGLAVQHEAILRRRMRFKALAAVRLTGVLLAIGVAILAAIRGFGYWALVAQQLVTSAGIAIGLWTVCGWRPSKPAKVEGLGELLAFGGNLTGAGILNYLSANLDDVLIGRFYGPQALGFFRKAHSLLRLPLRQINTPVTSVATPLLSRLVGQPKRYRTAYRRILEKLMLVTMPLGAVMVACSDWLVFLMLGEQWFGVVPIFIVLSLGIFLKPIGNTIGWLFITQDRTDEMLRWEVVASALAIGSFTAGLPLGVLYVAGFYTAVMVVAGLPISIHWACRRGPVASRDIYEMFAVHGGAVLATLAALVWLRYGNSIFEPIRVFGGEGQLSVFSALAGIGVAVILGGAVHLASLSMFSRGRRALVDAWRLVRVLWESGEQKGEVWNQLGSSESEE